MQHESFMCLCQSSPFGSLHQGFVEKGMGFPTRLPHTKVNLASMGLRKRNILGLKSMVAYAIGVYADENSLYEKLGGKYAKTATQKLQGEKSFYEDFVKEDINLATRRVALCNKLKVGSVCSRFEQPLGGRIKKFCGCENMELFQRHGKLTSLCEGMTTRQTFFHPIELLRMTPYSARSLQLTKLLCSLSKEEGTIEGEFHSLPSYDTIVAIATPVGSQQGSIAVIRLSGPLAIAVVANYFRSTKKSIHAKHDHEWRPRSHLVEHGMIVDDAGLIVDEVLIVPMLAPRSYTKEDVIEIQCHGGDVCVRRILHLCLEGGARLAQPGEFTLRAFLNGRIDLTQAESVAQLIASKSVVAAETALAALQGGLSSFVQDMRNNCLELLAEMDAHLDFEDEIPPLEIADLVGRINALYVQVQDALKTSNRGRLLQSGMQIAIVGRPNVGKSSLLNAWSKSNRAIVTDIAGTTRDIVEADVVVEGIPIKLLDTAGIRETDDIIEQIGVQRSEAAALGADIVIMMISAVDGWTTGDNHIFQKNISTMNSVPGTSQAVYEKVTTPWILVQNKIDRVAEVSVSMPDIVKNHFRKIVSTCVIKGIGLHELEGAVVDLMGLGEISSDTRKWAVNQRQAEQLLRARDALQRLKESINHSLPVDFWTIDLREAVLALGQVSGDDVSEEILSSIFSRFCIGK